MFLLGAMKKGLILLMKNAISNANHVLHGPIKHPHFRGKARINGGIRAEEAEASKH